MSVQAETVESEDDLLRQRLHAIQLRLKAAEVSRREAAGGERRSQRKRKTSVRLSSPAEGEEAAKRSLVHIVDDESDEEGDGPSQPPAPTNPGTEAADASEAEGPLPVPGAPVESSAAELHARGPAIVRALASASAGQCEARLVLLTTADGSVRARLRVEPVVDEAILGLAPTVESKRRRERRAQHLLNGNGGSRGSGAAMAAEGAEVPGKSGSKGGKQPAQATAEGVHAAEVPAPKPAAVPAASPAPPLAPAGARAAPPAPVQAGPSSAPGSHGETPGAQPGQPGQVDLRGIQIEPGGEEEADAVTRMSVEELSKFTEGEMRQLRMSSLLIVTRKVGLRLQVYPSAEKAAKAIKDKLYRDRKRAEEAAGGGNSACDATAGTTCAASALRPQALSTRMPDQSHAHLTPLQSRQHLPPVHPQPQPHLQYSVHALVTEASLQSSADFVVGTVGGLPLRRLVETVAVLPTGQLAPLQRLLHPRGRPPTDLESAGVAVQGRLVGEVAGHGHVPAKVSFPGPRLCTSAIREVVLQSLSPPRLRLRTAAGWFDASQPLDVFARSLLTASGSTASAPLAEGALAVSGAVPWAHRVWPIALRPASGLSEDVQALLHKCRYLTAVTVQGEDGAVAPLSELWAAARTVGKKDAVAGPGLASFVVGGLLALDQHDRPQAPPGVAGAPSPSPAPVPARAGAVPEGGVWVRLEEVTLALVAIAPAFALPGTNTSTALSAPSTPRGDTQALPAAATPGATPRLQLVLCVRSQAGVYALASPAEQYASAFVPPGLPAGAVRALQQAAGREGTAAVMPVALTEAELVLGARTAPGAHWRLKRYTVTATGRGGAPQPLFRTLREASQAQAKSSQEAKSATQPMRVNITADLDLSAPSAAVAAAAGSSAAGPDTPRASAATVTVRVRVLDVRRVTADFTPFSGKDASSAKPGQSPQVYVRTHGMQVFAMGVPSSPQATVQNPEDIALLLVGSLLLLLRNYQTKVPCKLVHEQAAKAVPAALGKADLLQNADQRRLAMLELQSASKKADGRIQTNVAQFTMWLKNTGPDGLPKPVHKPPAPPRETTAPAAGPPRGPAQPVGPTTTPGACTAQGPGAASSAGAGAPKKRVLMGVAGASSSAPVSQTTAASDLGPAQIGRPVPTASAIAVAVPVATGQPTATAVAIATPVRQATEPAEPLDAGKRKRGRPPGSKNKPRVVMGVGGRADAPAGGGKIPDCGVCAACLDMPKFGGTGVLKQRCIRKPPGRARQSRVRTATASLPEPAEDEEEDDDDEPLSKMVRITPANTIGEEPAAQVGPVATAPLQPAGSAIEQAIVAELERAAMPRSVKQLAAALRREKGQGESFAAEWESRVDSAIRHMSNSRVQSGDGLIWLA